MNDDAGDLIARERVAALKELLTAEIDRIDERHISFEAQTKANDEKQNEFRGALDDLGRTMATRNETENALKVLGTRLEEQQRQIGDLRSRLDVGPAALAALQSRVDISGGERLGSQASTANVYALVLVIAAVAAALGHYIH